MKYKVLLAGKNQMTIDDFFYAMREDFECLTTSLRGEDIEGHIRYFQPEALVYCIASGSKDDIMKLITALSLVVRKNIRLILVGDRESCEEIIRLRPNMVSLSIFRPISAGAVKEHLVNFLEEHRQPEMQQQMQLEKEILQAVEEQLPISPEYKETECTETECAEKQCIETKEKKHILIVDDDPMMLRLIKNELRERYNVATAVSGKIAFDFLERKQQQMDLILLDYEMPEEDGPTVFGKLRLNPKTRDVPIVFLTGINDREKIQKVLAMKPQGYLLKPIECEKLIQTIEQVIG